MFGSIVVGLDSKICFDTGKVVSLFSPTSAKLHVSAIPGLIRVKLVSLKEDYCSRASLKRS